MKIQNQVCSENQAKKLMELGVNQCSFNVAELGLMLHVGVNLVLAHLKYESDVLGVEWGWCLSAFESKRFNTEAEARADLLIHAMEQGFITAEVVNHRINTM